MATFTHTGMGNIPTIVRSAYGRAGERTRYKRTIKDSTALFYGQFVTPLGGTDTAVTSTGSEMGLAGYTTKQPILGFIEGFATRNGNMPIYSDPAMAGTITNEVLSGTTFSPYKYTTSATNDYSHVSGGLLSGSGEMAIIVPIMEGDILEVALTNNAGTGLVTRGTTTAAGSAGSSANPQVGLAVNASGPWSLKESTASTTLAGLDFLIVEVDGKMPTNPYHVFVECIRAQYSKVVTIS